MAFRCINSSKLRTVPVTIASATVIPAGDFAGMTSGLAVDAVDTTTALAWCPDGSADGETTCYLSTADSDLIFEGTADAAFAVTDKDAEVDLTAAQLIDLGESTYNVLLVDASENAGTVGSTANVRVMINPIHRINL